MRLKIVINKFIPFPGYKAMTILIWLFCHRQPDEKTVSHENIHLQQEIELLFVGFYLWYVVEFLVRWIGNGFHWDEAYKMISFEQEAYINEEEEDYLDWRDRYAWTKYL